tara:strand:+ start:339 stop:821 length:483 start_codon:yes stop_codon:yes gene_type:complete
MSVTNTPRRILYIRQVAGSIIEPDEWDDIAQTLNDVYNESKPHAYAFPEGRATTFLIGNNGGTFGEWRRFVYHVPAGITQLRWSLWGTDPNGAAQVRIVEDPDGAATVRDTQTLPVGTGTLPLSAAWTVSSGTQEFAIECANANAADATVNAIEVVTEDI